MVIYQRDLNRKIANLEETLSLLRRQFDPLKWDIEVLMHDKNRSPCMLSAMLHNADILLTPHGFQSMLLMFLPRTSILFEVKRIWYKYGFDEFVKYGCYVHLLENDLVSVVVGCRCFHTNILRPAMLDSAQNMVYAI